MRQPPPDRTSTSPRSTYDAPTYELSTYEGRPLPRPAEDVEDQGLAFDVRTLLSRRRILGAFGIGAGAAALAACGVSASTGSSGSTAGGSSSSAGTVDGLTEIPDETAGPYPGDGSNGPDVLEESGIVRRDIRRSFGTGSATAEGVPFTIQLTVLDLAAGGSPFVGVAVYAWHCDREGRYSLYSSGLEKENYLRGVQVSDDAGTVSFTSIVPACYTGRWPHVHFEVYPDADSISDAGTAIATSQLALPKNVADAVYGTSGYEQSVTNLAQVSLAGDNVFGDDSGAHQVATVTGSVSAGYTARLTVPVDTRTAPTAGAAPGGGGRSGGPGGGGEPPSGGPGGVPPSGAPSAPS